MVHQLYISLGTNIDRESHTRAGLNDLAHYFSNVRISRVYESEAVGFEGSHFYNLVAAVNTDKSVEAVCQCLKQIEDNNGRVRGEKKFAPRTLDLDLLLYDDLITSQGVELPRDEILYNAFVLLPLSELAPQVTHPVSGKTYAQLWMDYDKDKQNLWPIEFNWSSDAQ